MRILITGGAGFVGSSLAKLFKENDPDHQIVVFDNLHRRGSELNLVDFQHLNIEFIHGDIRNPSDLTALEGNFDLFIEASAEPSVLAGLNGSPNYLTETNLNGTLNCLEFARTRAGQFFFLSTSRVYSIQPLREIPLLETETRFKINPTPIMQGLSDKGISEKFPTHLPRSLYGATKLASELMIQEYIDTYQMRGVINRCGVIAGPGQFGKVDQGVFTLWVANHFFKKRLKYTGFGAQGKQVRDLLHPEDLFRLIMIQLEQIKNGVGEVVNVGGGLACSTSLMELTTLCEEITGNKIAIDQDPNTNRVDIPFYISDCSKAELIFGWQPRHSVRKIVKDIYQWLNKNEEVLKRIF